MHRASLILGTAGHIDHGKTALVRALTGVDTDRLKEEKERGITIDLGFADLQVGGFSMGLVDVPGHEAFVRNMVSGATGMDLVLLVVAADEGVMPQTREHLAIIGLLGIPRLVVALTKADLVSEEWLDLAREDVEELLRGTPYQGASIVPTSAADGRGLDELRSALEGEAGAVSPRSHLDLLRMPVDRAFAVAGAGTVVTGTIWSGTVKSGGRVRILPGGEEARVRSVQVHGSDVGEARAGQRAALALTGGEIHHSAIPRGSAVVTPEWGSSSRMLTVRVRVLPGTGWEVRHNQRVRVHLGTAEALARCALLEGPRLEGGETGWVQLRLESPVVARSGDRLILRAYSPVTTIGGGEVVEPLPPKRRNLRGEEAALLLQVRADLPDDRLAAVFGLAGWHGVPVDDLPLRAGCTPAEVEKAREEGLDVFGGIGFSPAIVATARSRILDRLREEHVRQRLRKTLPLSTVHPALPSWAPRELRDGVLKLLVDEGVMEFHDGEVRDPTFAPEPDERERERLRSIEELYARAGISPPMMSEVPDAVVPADQSMDLHRYLVDHGILTGLAPELFIHSHALRTAVERVRTEMAGMEGLGPADFREILPVSRKHLIPILGHMDSVGVTVRKGDARHVPPMDPGVQGGRTGVGDVDR